MAIKTVSLLIVSFIPIIIFNLPKLPNWWILLLPFLLGILLPTLLHVFAFSAAFMLSGYRKSKEPASLASFTLLIGGVIALAFWPMSPQPLPVALRPTLDFFIPLIELLSQNGAIFGSTSGWDSPWTDGYHKAFSSQIAAVFNNAFRDSKPTPASISLRAASSPPVSQADLNLNSNNIRACLSSIHPF